MTGNNRASCVLLQVGHALENDLAALRVLHSRCIDTAALYPHPKVPGANLLPCP